MSDEPLEQMMQVPDAVLLYILGLLPNTAKQWSAKLVNQEAYRLFGGTCKITATTPDLPLWITKQMFQQAASAAPENCVKLLAARASQGDLAAVSWLIDNDCPMDCSVCSAAAAGGHLETLQWLRNLSYPCPWDSWTTKAAAANGHLHVLQWLADQEAPPPMNSWTCEAAAAGGHLHVLQWLRSRTPAVPWNEWACEAAAAGGHLEVLQWLRSQQPPCPWVKVQCLAGAKNGKHQDVLQWIRSLPE